MNSITDKILCSFESFLNANTDSSSSYDYDYYGLDCDGNDVSVYVGLTISVHRKHTVLFEDEYGREETAELVDHMNIDLTYVEYYANDELDCQKADELKEELIKITNKFENG